MLVELDLARSSYFYHCARQRLPDKYADARVAITDVFQSNHRCYGYRRVRAALGRRDLRLSEKSHPKPDEAGVLGRCRQ